MDKPSYVLISPCRNEEDYIEETINSIIKQTILPDKWIIIDDGSNDNTPKILNKYSAQYKFIEVINRPDRGSRSVGPGVIDAFYEGLDSLDLDKYSYLCKLDMDLRLPPKYFEILIGRMETNHLIATCSGKSYIQNNDKIIFERHGDDMSLGMTKLYRISQFKEIGGFVREVMWDGIDCHKCRMKGWIACSWDEPDLRFIHLRAMGSSQVGILTGRMRHGFGQYFMGTGFLFMFASSIFRLNQKPYIIGSIATLWGWVLSFIKCTPRFSDKAFRSYLKKYHRQILLKGKTRVMREYMNRQS